jgi:hypothetical protein
LWLLSSTRSPLSVFATQQPAGHDHEERANRAGAAATTAAVPNVRGGLVLEGAGIVVSALVNPVTLDGRGCFALFAWWRVLVGSLGLIGLALGY